MNVHCMEPGCDWVGDAKDAAEHGRLMHQGGHFEREPEVIPMRAWKVDCAGTCKSGATWHMVLESPDDGMLHCDCPAFKHGKNCRHRTNVLIWIRHQPHTVISAVGSGGWKPKENT